MLLNNLKILKLNLNILFKTYINKYYVYFEAISLSLSIFCLYACIFINKSGDKATNIKIS